MTRVPLTEHCDSAVFNPRLKPRDYRYIFTRQPPVFCIILYKYTFPTRGFKGGKGRSNSFERPPFPSYQRGGGGNVPHLQDWGGISTYQFNIENQIVHEAFNLFFSLPHEVLERSDKMPPTPPAADWNWNKGFFIFFSSKTPSYVPGNI